MKKLKICGTANVEDARLTGAMGADYCGILVDVGFSERTLSLEKAREVAEASGTENVILLCNPDIELVENVAAEIQPFAIQLLCEESPEFLADVKTRVTCQVWKTLHLPVHGGQKTPEAYVEAGADALLIDAVDTSEGFTRFGGTGKVADWQAAAKVKRQVGVPVFLAGGIRPDNVADAICTVRPDGIDLCSGVEAAKGKKDPEKMRLLIENFNRAIASTEGV
jgi:phosphoribosylanthranilate isomerase